MIRVVIKIVAYTQTGRIVMLGNYKQSKYLGKH